MSKNILNEDYSQRARNFRVNLRTRLAAMKSGQKISYGKLVYTKDGSKFKTSKGRSMDLESLVQDLKHAVKPDILRHRGAAGADMVNAYLKFEGKVNEGQPMFQDTPNEMAYLDFKKWAYKNRKSVKGILSKAVEDGRDPGTDIFLTLRQVWLAWANKNAKEWSRVPNKGPQGKDFGRALAVMMKKDNLIIKKSGNKLTDMQEDIGIIPISKPTAKKHTAPANPPYDPDAHLDRRDDDEEKLQALLTDLIKSELKNFQ